MFEGVVVHAGVPCAAGFHVVGVDVGRDGAVAAPAARSRAADGVLVAVVQLFPVG